MKTNDIMRFAAATALLILVEVLASGCATTATQPGSNAGSVPLPQYAAGETYVYSNGTWEQVVQAGPETVVWENHRGDRSSGSPDFTLRRQSWESGKRAGGREFLPRNDLIGAAPPDSIWPLAQGKTASYVEEGAWTGEDGVEKTYRNLWRLEVAGIETVAVLAGEFEAWKIVGKRYGYGGPGSRSRLYEKRTWYYAPDAGHWVLVTRDYYYDRPSRRLELLAVLPPEAHLPDGARRKLAQGMQQALEKQASGNPLRWTQAGDRVSGTITPLATYRLPDGTYCRNFRQELQLSGDSRTYYAMACRSEAGTWVIPHR
jgi:hypothetical protein